jgi:hypothetical protein
LWKFESRQSEPLSRIVGIYENDAFDSDARSESFWAILAICVFVQIVASSPFSVIHRWEIREPQLRSRLPDRKGQPGRIGEDRHPISVRQLGRTDDQARTQFLGPFRNGFHVIGLDESCTNDGACGGAGQIPPWIPTSEPVWISRYPIALLASVRQPNKSE